MAVPKGSGRKTARPSVTKGRSKRTQGKRAARQRPRDAPLSAREPVAKDLEDLLIDDMVLGIPDYSDHGSLLATSLYSASPELRRLAYNHGLSVGREIYRISGGKGMLPLLNVLDNAGIGRMLYTPAGDVTMIKGTTRSAHGMKLDCSAHAYEAGMISGYLSAHLSRGIATEETQCRHSGSMFCQFVSGGASVSAAEAQCAGPERATDCISRAIPKYNVNLHGRSQSYVMLSLLPLTAGPALGDASRLMFLAGGKLGRKPVETREALGGMASFMGIRMSGFSSKGRSISVRLEYNDRNSSSGFVELSTKAFIGFLSKRFNSVVRLSEGRHGNAYSVTLSATQGA